MRGFATVLRYTITTARRLMCVPDHELEISSRWSWYCTRIGFAGLDGSQRQTHD